MSDSIFLTDGNGILTGLVDRSYSGELIIPEYVAGERITAISDFAFENCSGLTSVIIPNSVISIGFAAFGYCSGLTSVTIPGSVTSIGESAFWGCPNLTTVYVPDPDNLSPAVSIQHWLDIGHFVTFEKYYPYEDESSGKIKPRLHNNNVDLQKILDAVNALPEAGSVKPKKLLSSLAEGSLVSVLEDGKLTPFYVAKHNYEADLNGEGRTLLVRKSLYGSTMAWNSSDVNAYATSTIDAWLNSEYKEALSPIVKADIGFTTFEYTVGNGDKTKTTLQRSVFLPSVTEMGASDTDCNVEGIALPIAGVLGVAYNESGTANFYWTRTPRTAVTTQVKIILTDGTADEYGAANAAGAYARPCFTLPATMALRDVPYDDGSWGLADEYEPTDTVAITENGIHNVKGYSFANVDVAPKLLWTNASPTSSFADQTVAVDGSEFDAYLVEARLNTTDATSQAAYIRKTTAHQLLAVTPKEAQFSLRFITSATDSGITFSYYNNSGTSQCIPTRIWGVKFTL